MLTLILTLAVLAFFAGIVALIARLSGRQYSGQITGPLGNEQDYDNPYPGWGARLFGMNTYFEQKLDQPPAVSVDDWPKSRSR